jgi:hypothetical protein
MERFDSLISIVVVVRSFQFSKTKTEEARGNED